MKQVDIYVDGSFDGSKASWAFIAVDNDIEIHRQKGYLSGEINEMRQIGGEIESVLRAVEFCASNGYVANIYYDYIGIFKWVADSFGEAAWKTNNKWTKAYRSEILSKANCIKEFKKVKSHSGDKWNEEVDKFASSDYEENQVLEPSAIKPKYCIGITGVARAGKDSIYEVISDILAEKNKSIEVVKFPLAEELKKELDDFCVSNYGISCYTEDPKYKKILRPMMVSHGYVKRQLSDGTYWTSICYKKIQAALLKNPNILPIITDIRYDEFAEDEAYWLKKMGGKLIHVTRILEDGSINPPANKDEAKWDPLIAEKSDYKLCWKTNPLKGLRRIQVEADIYNILSKLKLI
jgi:ribonuclease HI